MDEGVQTAIFKIWADADAVPVAEPRGSSDTQPGSDPDHSRSPAPEKPDHHTKASGNDYTMKSDANEKKELSSEIEIPKEVPQTSKKRSASTHRPAEIFRSLVATDNGHDNGKNRRSRQSILSTGGDSSSSIYTVDSNGERRLSDRMKKAWRGVKGQKTGDPLEQWMVKHSGGILRNAPVRRASRESSDSQ